MRIGYVVSRFPKTTETFIAREAATVARSGHDVSVISIRRQKGEIIQPEASPFMPSLIAGSDAAVTDAFRSQVRWLTRKPGRLARSWIRGLAGNVRSPKFLSRAIVTSLVAPWVADRVEAADLDHLHAHWGSHSALLAYQLSILTDRPFSVTLHAHDLHIDRTMLGEKLRAAASVATISRHNQDMLAEFYPDIGSKVSVVHCGVDVDAISVRADEPVNDPPRIVVVAGLRPFKGHRHLFDAQRLLAERGRPVQLELVGDGPLRAELEAAAGVDVTFHGARPVDEVLKLVTQADLAVMPSVVLPNGRRDGIPVALIEAMALGVPVISTRVSGIPELIEHEHTGLLVEQQDPVGLADAVERLLDDRALRTRLAKAGRQRVVDEFDINASASKMVDLFRSASNRLSPPPAPANAS